MNKLLYISFLVCLFVSTQLFSEQLILHSKQILNVDTGDLYQSQILIEDGMIVKIERDLSKKQKHIKVVDLSRLTLIPGLMDSHVHLIGNTKLKGYKSIGESSYLSTIYGVDNAKKTLLAGFTTVRNVGAGNYADVALK